MNFLVSALFFSVMSMAASQIGVVTKYKTIDAELTYVRTSMYTSHVHLDFLGQIEDFENCANLYVFDRDPSTGEHGNLVTCRDHDKVLTLFVRETEVAVSRSILKGHGVEYRGGVLTFLKKI